MKFLLLALKYLPSVLQAVVVVEDIASGKAGTTKKAIVMNSLQAAAAITGGMDNQTAQVISALIDTTVKDLNSAGVFTKSVPLSATTVQTVQTGTSISGIK